MRTRIVKSTSSCQEEVCDNSWELAGQRRLDVTANMFGHLGCVKLRLFPRDLQHVEGYNLKPKARKSKDKGGFCWGSKEPKVGPLYQLWAPKFTWTPRVRH